LASRAFRRTGSMESRSGGVNLVEMKTFRKISPQDLDRLYAHGSGSEELEDIFRLVQNVRSKYLGEIDPELETAHLAALMQVVNSTDKGDLVARASKVKGPVSRASGLPQGRRRFALQSVFATLSAKLALGGAAVAMAATGGLAGTGNLPDQVQTAAAHAAEKVGIVIPLGETAQGAAGGVSAIAEQTAESVLQNARAAARVAEPMVGMNPDQNSEFGQDTAVGAISGGAGSVSDAARAQAEERKAAGQSARPEDAGPPTDSRPLPEAGPPAHVPAQGQKGQDIAGDAPVGGPIPTSVPGGTPAGEGGGRP